MNPLTGSLQHWRQHAQFMDAPHGRIAWWMEGKGKPLLLIHGFPTASWDWARIWPDLVGAKRQVIALDMLGFGYSDKPASHRYDLMQQTDLHVLLLEALHCEGIDIVAHDYGVSIAQELLARQGEDRLPFRIDSVSFLNGGLIPDQHRPRMIQRLLEGPLGPVISRAVSRDRFATSFAAVFGPNSQPDEAELADFWSLLTHADGHRLGHKLIRYMADRRRHRDRWVSVLSAGIARQRLINGGLDPVSGAHLADAYEALVPDADIIRLDDVGHYPQWEAPDRVASAILEILR